MFKKRYLIFIVLLISFFLRSYKLDSYPPLNPDEAALGYNAYSLLETGKDEHGQAFPIHFKSFGDFKPGGYVYLAIPFVKLLGLNALAVRLPNLLISTISIFYLYKLVRILSGKTSLALISAAVLTFSPWHIQFSRGAWEASIALSLVIIGTYYFYLFLQNKKFYSLILFVLLFSASLYTYHSARILAPLLALFLVTTHFKSLLNLKTVAAFIIGLIITTPVAVSFLTNGGQERFAGVGLFADQGPLWRANELLSQHNLPIFKIFHNQKLLYLISWFQKYLSHFDLNYLFATGDEVPRSRIPNFGQFYHIFLPLLYLGTYKLLKNYKKYPEMALFVLAFLLISPIASSLTFQAPSALRSLPLVVPLSIPISLGIYSLTKSKYSKVTVYLAPLVFISFVLYFKAYFIDYQKIYPYSWGYGFKDAISYLLANRSTTQEVYFTNKYDQPYIQYLFFSKFDPASCQNQISLTPKDKYGFSTVAEIDKIHFQKIDWDKIPSGSLVVASDEPIPAKPQYNIDFPNHQSAFKFYVK